MRVRRWHTHHSWADLVRIGISFLTPASSGELCDERGPNGSVRSLRHRLRSVLRRWRGDTGLTGFTFTGSANKHRAGEIRSGGFRNGRPVDTDFSEIGLREYSHAEVCLAEYGNSIHYR